MRRAAQREATRQRLVECAVEALICGGVAALTTAEVQRRSGGSRGALLHHFPTRAELVEAVIDEIVARNERAVDTVAAEDDDSDPVGRAVRVLHVALSEPAFGAELELWTAARTDGELRAALRRAEHRAERDLDRVVAALFGPALAAHPRYPVVAELTTALLRGLLVAGPLRGGAGRSDQLLVEWAAVIHQMLDRH